VPYRIHQVEAAIPPGRDDAARKLYVGVFGRTEIPRPSSFAARGSLRCRLHRAELHLGPKAEFRRARGARPALEVDGRDALRPRLRAYRVPARDDELVPGRKRSCCQDPFGNRFEFVEAGG